MGDLVDFAKRIQLRLADANRDPHWGEGEADRYMEEVGERRQQFDILSSRLNGAVIRPRLETLASYFRASPAEDQPAGHCLCWFSYCERFPASTKVAFAVEHDLRFENVVVRYEASMMPLFIKLAEHDRLTFPLDEVVECRVADWVEDRLLEFLEAYLQIDRGGDDLDDELASDPVCGMRISRSKAAASDTHRGHPYYFCSAECQDKFSREPTRYVQLRTM